MYAARIRVSCFHFQRISGPQKGPAEGATSTKQKIVKKFDIFFSGQVLPRQGTEICNFGAPSPLEALHWIFCCFSSVYVQFRKTSPLKSGESSEKSSGENRVKSCHVCGCHGFFGPDFQQLDERRITHLVCARLKYDLYDFFGGVLGLLPFFFLYKRPKTPPEKVI